MIIQSTLDYPGTRVACHLQISKFRKQSTEFKLKRNFNNNLLKKYNYVNHVMLYM